MNKDNNTIKSIKLSIYYKNNRIDHIDIPISSIKIFEINGISSSLIYIDNGRYDLIDTCRGLELELSTKYLDNNVVKKLLSNINIYTVNLIFNNNDKIYYNLPYYSKNGFNNNLQSIKKNDSKITILLGRNLKYE